MYNPNMMPGGFGDPNSGGTGANRAGMGYRRDRRQAKRNGTYDPYAQAGAQPEPAMYQTPNLNRGQGGQRFDLGNGGFNPWGGMGGMGYGGMQGNSMGGMANMPLDTMTRMATGFAGGPMGGMGFGGQGFGSAGGWQSGGGMGGMGEMGYQMGGMPQMQNRMTQQRMMSPMQNWMGGYNPGMGY